MERRHEQSGGPFAYTEGSGEINYPQFGIVCEEDQRFAVLAEERPCFLFSAHMGTLYIHTK